MSQAKRKLIPVLMLLVPFIFVGCIGEPPKHNSNAQNLAAVVDTKVYDGSTECQKIIYPFGILESCAALTGMSHSTKTPSGNLQIIYNGTIESWLIFNGREVARSFSDRHIVFFVKDGKIQLLHNFSCIKLGSSYFNIKLQLVNGKFVFNSREATDSC